MAESQALDIELIKKRAIAGVVTLTLRTFFIQIFTFVATFILTILLEPAVFGVFFVVSAIINLFIYFSDVGLAAALIQKKDEPKRQDLVTTFTIQQFIIFTLVIGGMILVPQIARFYRLDEGGIWLLRSLLFSLILSSLKTIPSIILERRLNFTRLVIPQIAENAIFYTVAVTLAILNFGVLSFAWAVLARGLGGLVLIYLLSPWMPAIGITRVSAKSLISFGIPFQVNSILALVKDDLLTVFLGKILPFAQMGFVGWAQKWAYLPLRFFMDNVNKVTFPAYSRLQNQKVVLGKAIEKSLFFVTYLVYPSVFGMAAIAQEAVSLIPKYQKWEPALPLLYLFLVNVIFSAVSTTFTNALFAIGKPQLVLKLMVFWSSATWLMTYPLVLKFGYVGVGLASAIVAATSVVTIYFVKKEIPIKIGSSIFGPFFVSVIMFLALKGIENLMPPSIVNLAITIILGAIIYFIVSFSIFRRHLIENAQTIIGALIFKK